MKVLNLYAGIGGNRKLWTDVEVTAVEYRQDIADVYKSYFPDDEVIVADAHEYLLNNYNKYDFIWSSPPCPTWSRANFWASRNAVNREKYYPDMKLYQEVWFLRYWFDGLWVVENVEPYSDPLDMNFKKVGRHYFWSNFPISKFKENDLDIHKGKREEWSEKLGFDLSGFKINSRKDQIYRNCVHPETGLHVLNCARSIVKPVQPELF